MDMRIMFLDDMPIRHSGFMEACREMRLATGCRTSVDWAQTAAEAVGFLERNPRYDLAALDHDLEAEAYADLTKPGGERTGYEVARFIGEDLPPEACPRYACIHTMNPHGAQRMASAIAPRLDAGDIEGCASFPFSAASYGKLLHTLYERVK